MDTLEAVVNKQQVIVNRQHAETASAADPSATGYQQRQVE
jgi:hypothetical protein